MRSYVVIFQNLVRLAQYGLNCINGNRGDLEYRINSSWYLPPERFLQAEIKNGFICLAGDIWSFGIAALELSIVGQFLFFVQIESTSMKSVFYCLIAIFKLILTT